MLKLIILFVALFQQSPSPLDSLKKELIAEKDAKKRAELYYLISKATFSFDQDAAIAFTDSAISLAEIHELPIIKGNSLNVKGVSYLIKSDYETAMKIHLEALKIREDIKDTTGLMESHLNIGNILYRTGNGVDAAKRYRIALNYARLSNNQRGLSLLYNNLGSYFRDRWEEGKQKDDLDSAKHYLYQSLEAKTSLNDSRGSINTLNQLASIVRMEGDLNNAQKLLTQALEISKGIQDQEKQISLLSELAHFNIETKNLNQALAYARSAMEIAEEMNSLYMIGSASHILGAVYEELGDYRNALIYAKRRLEIEQKLNKEENKKVREEMLVKYDSEKKERENQQLLQEQKFLDLSIRRKNELLLGAGLILIGLIGGWIYQTYKNKELASAHEKTTEILNQLQATNEKILSQSRELEESNLALTKSNRVRQRLFSILSHDLKTPVSSLQTILDLWGNKMITEEEFQEVLPKVSDQIQGVRDLMENLLEWAQAELDHSQITVSEVAVFSLVQDMLRQMASAIKGKNLTVLNEVPLSTTLNTDRDRLSFILRNLLSNAIKFTPESGTIKVHYDPATADKLCVTDTGIGMDSSKLESLFSGKIVSKLGTKGEKGTGVGLLLCKEFAQSLGAKLEVESKPNAGSTFSIKWG